MRTLTKSLFVVYLLFSFSLQELTVQPSRLSDQLLSSKTMADLTDLALVCLCYCVTSPHTGSMAPQGVRRRVFDDLMRLMVCLPPLLHNMLVVLRTEVSGKRNSLL